jgi:hypothetical protein
METNTRYSAGHLLHTSINNIDSYYLVLAVYEDDEEGKIYYNILNLDNGNVMPYDTQYIDRLSGVRTLE